MGEPDNAVGTPRPLTRLRRDLTWRAGNERSATFDPRDAMTRPILAAAASAILLPGSGLAPAAAPAAAVQVASGDPLEAFNRARSEVWHMRAANARYHTTAITTSSSVEIKRKQADRLSDRC